MLGITRELVIKNLRFCGLAFIILLPLPFAGDYVTHIAIMTMIYSITAASLDILVGYTGKLSLGHAAFFTIGAYASALLSINFNISPWIGMVVGGILAASFGLVLGIPSLRLKGPYLAISTLGFGIIVQLMLVNLDWLTRGPIGITNIPPFPGGIIDLRIKTNFFYVALMLFMLTMFLLNMITKSRIGKILVAIREDEDAALSIGVNVSVFKILAFVLATFFAGISGGLYAHYIRYISPSMSALSESVHILSMTIIGGINTIIGPVLGAVLLTVLQELLRPYLEYRYLIYGSLIVLVMKYFPYGLFGVTKLLLEKVKL
jgi:branched-chain amino acid transport system permease protein